ncbi:SdpI family protein [Bosea sp. WAO]|uniref:SdpI family protein n=1 Tax=Bosea sp. WAO TaxID=406341 RepID=UPI0008332404|nr:SdpI family protein [Bosea sp. WAO]
MIRHPLLMSLALIGVMLAASAFALGQVPADAQIAVHFDINGRPDRFAAPWLAFLVLPGLALAATVLFALLPRLEPLAANLARSGKAYVTTWHAVILVLAACHALLVGNALGLMPDVPRLTSALLGLFLIATGNVAGKTRPMQLFGIRTPWTLADRNVWEKTHRFYGRASVGLGFGLVALALAGAPPLVLASACLGGLALLLAGSTGYSYWLSRQVARS